MTDEFDKLRTALKAPAPAPAPDAAAKAEAIRLAMENFDRHQETAKVTRPMSDRPERAGVLTGVRDMISKLTTRGALTATASIAAIGIGVMIWPSLEGREGMREPSLPVAEEARPIPAAPVVEEAEEKAEAPTAAPMAEFAPAEKRQRSGEITLKGYAEVEAFGGSTAETRFHNDVATEFSFSGSSDPALEFGSQIQMDDAAAGQQPAAQSDEFWVSGSMGKVTLGDAEAEFDWALNDIYAGTGVSSDYRTHVTSPRVTPTTETYATEAPNPVKIVAEEPVSTFSIDTDTASYSVIRSSLTNGQLPAKEAVRIEEMVNYFPYDYAAPEAGEAPFRAAVSLFQTPWNEHTQLLRVGLQGELPALDDRPPLNLVFLIDTSGSMDQPNKLPLLKQSFRLMLGELRPEDRVAIVTYAGSAGLVLNPTAASDRATILAALERLDAGGSTAGAQGLRQAYQVAESMAEDGEVSRILLATDGDFNVGIHDPEELKEFIADKRDSGTYLSVLGFGRGNLDDATMQALAQNGNGTAAYIDTLSEAQKVLVDQLSGALFPIADDVKIQIEFNPAAVAEYRLVGYETRTLAREDFNNDRVDAGEIGAGHQVTALYEITPVGSPAQLSDPLRYAAQTEAEAHPSELGFLKLRYKKPGEDTSKLIETPIPLTPGEADPDASFAAAIAGMGQLLSEPKYLGDWGWDEAIALANTARGADEFGYRAEAVQLMRLAESLSR